MKLEDFKITRCDITDIIMDSIRFCTYLITIHMFSSLLYKKERLFNIDIINSVIISVLALGIYHIIIKKIFINPIKKLKKICEKDNTIKKE